MEHLDVSMRTGVLYDVLLGMVEEFLVAMRQMPGGTYEFSGCSPNGISPGLFFFWRSSARISK